jgi:hypothetical protein
MCASFFAPSGLYCPGWGLEGGMIFASITHEKDFRPQLTRCNLAEGLFRLCSIAWEYRHQVFFTGLSILFDLNKETLKK